MTSTLTGFPLTSARLVQEVSCWLCYLLTYTRGGQGKREEMRGAAGKGEGAGGWRRRGRRSENRGREEGEGRQIWKKWEKGGKNFVRAKRAPLNGRDEGDKGVGRGWGEGGGVKGGGGGEAYLLSIFTYTKHLFVNQKLSDVAIFSITIPRAVKHVQHRSVKRKKEEIWLSPMTEAPTPTEKSKKQRDNTKNATKNFDYTTIADRLRTVSWGNDSHPAGVVKPVYGIPTFPLTAKAV